MQGQVKWFSSAKGFGFISSKEVENDIFIHFSDIQMEGYKSLEKDDLVEFDYDAEKEKALNLKKIAKSQDDENTEVE